jgi:glucose-6-phosphate 1-dehydrogenase
MTPPTNKNSQKELTANTIIVVLGASGDLAKKKTFPALFGLVCPLRIRPS